LRAVALTPPAMRFSQVIRRTVFLLGGIASICGAQSAGPGDAQEFFETKVRPVLANNCLACHGASKMGGLRLDSRQGLVAGGTDGPVIVPGHPEESVLIQAILKKDVRFKMPPAGQLSSGEIDSLTAWVKNGAVWPEERSILASTTKRVYLIRPDQRAFWSFQPVRRPAVPAIKNPSWARDDIDRFMAAKLQEKGLWPVPAADKRTLLRRATFDLIGLPPTPEEVDDFIKDSSPEAFAKVVDRLLASPHYGERWGRHWLDYARYTDEKFAGPKGDTEYANAYRYRDWVVQAFNEDLPYDQFIKAQIAADMLPEQERAKLLPGLGFYGLSPTDQEDRVDVTTRTFLGLTVACARCHDHKYDPIPTADYYSLLGVFKSTEYREIPLAPEAQVKAYQEVKKQIRDQKSELADFLEKLSTELSELLAHKTARYMVAAWKVIQAPAQDFKRAAEAENLDEETLGRMVKYIKNTDREHPYLKEWDALLARGPSLAEVEKAAEKFQLVLLAAYTEKHDVDDRNYVTLGGAKGAKDGNKRTVTNVESLEITKFYLWRDFAFMPYNRDSNTVKFEGGVYYYGKEKLERWISGEWKIRLQDMRDNLARLEKSLPPAYPFLHAVQDAAKPENAKIEIRGDETNLGDEVPRRFLQILCQGTPSPFTKGSGRLELADAIASPANPLTARVMVNRIWELHFGQGIVRSPSNFGKLGEAPDNPELLDYLASTFVEEHWSIKALHRRIMLSSTYRLSTTGDPSNLAKDAGNHYLWRANVVPRLDIESLRDAVLAVTGNLDPKLGGPPVKLTSDESRRTLYGFVSREKLDPLLELFDFPNPNTTSEYRTVTIGPLQSLYFMNSPFIARQARELANRLDREAAGDEGKIVRAYRLLFGRYPTKPEIQLGRDFLKASDGAWPRYTQALLASAEFSSVN
jgi:mono/diheme cytochrome c family protein